MKRWSRGDDLRKPFIFINLHLISVSQSHFRRGAFTVLFFPAASKAMQSGETEK